MLVYVGLSRPTSLDGLYLTNAKSDFMFRHVTGSIDREFVDEMTEASLISDSCTIRHASLHMVPCHRDHDRITSHDQLLVLTDHGDDDLVQELSRTSSTHVHRFVKRAYVLHHKDKHYISAY